MTQKRDKTERKTQIMETALNLFAEVGYEKASLEETAKRAGVTKGCIYHYFTGKKELFIEVSRHYSSPMIEILELALQDVNGLENFIRANLNFWADHPKEYRFFFSGMLAFPVNNEDWSVFYEHYERHYPILEQLILKSGKHKDFAFALICAIDGAITMIMTKAIPKDEAIEKLVTTFCR